MGEFAGPSDPRAWAALERAIDELDAEQPASGEVGDYLATRLWEHGLDLADLHKVIEAKAKTVGRQHAELVFDNAQQGREAPGLDVLLGASCLIGMAEGFVLGLAFAEHRRRVDVA